MRVIAGKYKRRNIIAVPGNTARPTTDYVRELIFSLNIEWENAKILDLYAGSGAIGLEALSRGAFSVDFVEFAWKSIQTIKNNIMIFNCKEQTRIYRKKVNPFLKKCAKKYDIIFLDPPYNKNLVNESVNLILQQELLNEEGKIIVEHSFLEKIEKKLSESVQIRKKAGETIITVLQEINSE